MTNNRLNILVAAVVSGILSVPAYGGSVTNLKPGELATRAAEMTADKELTVTGRMDASDFFFILDNFHNLQSLDLSGVEVVAYAGNPLPYTGSNASPANTLPAYSLTGMGQLTDLKFPSGLKAIGKGALSGSGITSVIIPQGVAEIGAYAFMRCGELATVTIPSTVVSIGDRAFAYCDKLRTVDFSGGSSLAEIPQGLFEACGGLQSLNLTALARCKEIGPWALAECRGLVTLVLPAGTAELADGSLYGTSSVQTLTLPADLSYIGDNAMSDMSALSSIMAADATRVPELGSDVWARVLQQDVTLVTPDALVNDFRGTPQWEDFNIVDYSHWQATGTGVIAVEGPEEMTVTYSGDRIEIRGAKPLEEVAVFNVAGIRQTGFRTAGKSAEVSVAGWPHGVYLVVTSIGVCKITI